MSDRAATRAPTATAAHRFTATPDGLDRVGDPGVLLACWMRKLAPEIEHWLAGVWFPLPRQARWSVGPDDDPSMAAGDGVGRWLVDRAPAPQAWLDDIVDLVSRARRIRPSSTASVRLESVANDGCRLFHVDQTALRVLCTYRGPGTQWLPDAAVDRDRLAAGDNGHVRDWSVVASIGTGWVAAMKGDRWPGEPGRGLVHRSPPAPPTAPRILLAIDLDG